MGGGYTAGCLFYHDYIKNRYLLIAVDLDRQKNSILVQKQHHK